MALSIINSIVSWILKKRIHQIELFIKYPHDVQNELLLQLIQRAKFTEIGKKYDFSSIFSYSQFAERVPVSTYEEVEPLIERSRKGESNIYWPEPIKYFAKSSGTTNAKSKFIPVSTDALENCHYKAGKDMLCLYLNNNEDSQLFTGKSLRLGGSKQLYADNNTIFGDLSAILIDNLPFWAELSSTPNSKVSLMSEWNEKMKAIVKETKNENVTSLLGVPSWLLVLLNNVMQDVNKSSLLEIWPNAEVYFHGGISFEPYREQYQKLFPKENFRFYENYNASEGFFAIQDRNNANDMLLMLDYGIFYEFIPMDTFATSHQKTVSLADVQMNKSYAVVITTNSGLWRYLIGDTVRFTSLNPYRIKITGRTKHYINVFGEELMIENTDKALAITANEFQVDIVEYTVAPVFMEGKEKGAHEWMIEFKKDPSDLKAFAKRLDENIQNINSDYEAKRYNSMTLNELKLNVAKPNLFHLWLSKQDKLGGQNKIPRLSNDRSYLEQLKTLNN
ncbi:GH3 auxin-responsive promoter family protein [Flavobacterium sp. CBA20B-1]|uniref:GH3 auxin-responsive promoter family protein n=1 Tax=unclassified Flavobacterium TaxID=196869 RepID=UPI0022246A10|nr:MULTISPECIES: GH3 auxin-responsive promoter family protein [unclassified Flavobacterium]WCM42976.1 GH3 auxin-responsive promoter family protein [Flavobacterium sp. CBA20B-1]